MDLVKLLHSLAVLGVAVACHSAPPAPPTPPPAAPPAEAVLLRLRGEVGQIRHLRTTMDNYMHFGPGAPPSGDSARPAMRMIQFTTETVTAISGDTVTVVLVTDSSRMDMTGLPVPAAVFDSLDSRGLTITTRMDRRGRAFSTETRGAARLEARMASVRQMLPGIDSSRDASRGAYTRLPDRPVRVGETWADTSAMPRSLGSSAGVVVATWRFERIELRGGRRIAVISSDIEMPPMTVLTPMRLSSGPMRTVGETEFDLDAGWIVRQSTTMTGSTHTEMGDISMRMVMRQAPLGDQR